MKIKRKYLNPYSLLDLIFGRSSLRTTLQQGNVSQAAEIGVREGINAASILRIAKPKRMFCVDPYKGYSQAFDMPYADIEHIAHRRLKRFQDRVTWIKSDNRQYIKQCIGSDNDYIYIDAAHNYTNVYADISAYWPCIKPGGVLAGHDIGKPSVMRAVADFTQRWELDFQCGGTDWQIIERSKLNNSPTGQKGKT